MTSKINRGHISLGLVLGLTLLFTFSSCQRLESSLNLDSRNCIIGIKIYKFDGNTQPLFEVWKKLGINTAFVGVELARNSDFIRAARQAGINTFIIVPIFYNPEILAASPDLYAITGEGKPARDDWVEFICPGKKDYRHEIAEKVKKLASELEPDGLSIDFIRHFIFWEKVYPESIPDMLKTTCFCQDCQQAFQKDTGIIIPAEIRGYPAVARWIIDNHQKEWTAWRCGQITSMVEEMAMAVRQVKPFFLLNVHLVPWREEDFAGARTMVAAQDIKAIARHVDFLSPMCYAHMVKRPPSWINSVVADIKKDVPNPVLPSIQVKEAYLPEKLSPEEFDRSLQEALKPPSRGVIFWNWETLEQSAEKQEIVKKRVHQFLETAERESKKALGTRPVSRAGLRASPYGPRKPFPGIEYWLRSSKDMARRFPASAPAHIWIVSSMERDTTRPGEQALTSRTRLTFPAPQGNSKKYKNIVFTDEDINEPYLKAFDRSGHKVWLQVEPAMADVPTLIDLIMERYGHHPCVIGFGIDVEWHKWTEKDNEGVAVSDEEVRSWAERLRRINHSYLLFLKHWEKDKLPPAYREGLVFIDDSQIFPSLDEMLIEFSRWSRWFYPAPVGFQYGYPSDRPWWQKLKDPPAEIGRAILAVAPNTADLYWVDFTMKEIWPDKEPEKK